MLHTVVFLQDTGNSYGEKKKDKANLTVVTNMQMRFH